MKRNWLFFFLVAGALLSSGCNSEAEVSAGSTAAPVSTEGDQTKGDNVQTNAPVYNDPSKAPESGGYKIEPANKDDPKFKPDPKLGGGG